MPRPVLLFGASGNLGAALRSRLTADGHPVHAIAWKEAAAWLTVPDEQRLANIRQSIDAVSVDDVDILFAGGLTDPRATREQLFRSNTDFPKRVIEATRHSRDCRYMTFGSIMEQFGGDVAANPYVASKIELGRWVEEQALSGGLAGRIIHLQIHTLYGGAEPVPHMFLGQLVAALRQGQSFAMSAGQQLREYHHVEDIAGAIERLLSAPAWPYSPVLPLSSGKPVALADLARAIFESAGRLSDLGIGQLATADSENLTRTFEPAPAWVVEPSRAPIAGVCTWVNQLLQRG